MSDQIGPVEESSPDQTAHAAQKVNAQKAALANEQLQIVSQESVYSAAEGDLLFSPRHTREKFQTLEEKLVAPPPTQKGEKGQKGEKSQQGKTLHFLSSSDTDAAVRRSCQRNPELKKQVLLTLLGQFRGEDSTEEILDKVSAFYQDKFLADEALDFLINISQNRKILREQFIRARLLLHKQERKEIVAGRNMAALSREFAKKGLGSPTALRDIYQDVTSNPRSPQALFKELTGKFRFSEMKNIIDFILHSIGADLRAKGSSIPPAQLKRLLNETRTVQAILGLFRFFFARMAPIKKAFRRSNLTMPSQISFDLLARLLMRILEDRYPSQKNIFKSLFALGISQELAAQIIVLTQYRDAMRHLSPKLFKSERHRQELLSVLLDLIEDLEDDLEDDLEQE